MKHFLLCAVVSLFCMPLLADDKEATETPDRKKIEILMTYIDHGPERSLGGDVEAWFHTKTKTIEIFVCDIKTADIYIVDSGNEIVDFISVDSAMTQSVILDSPLRKGVYYLVIDSPVVYGGGCFTVN